MTTGQQTEQLNFSQAEYGSKKKPMRRDVFLAKMESVVPWARMPRMYFVQQWYDLADKANFDRLIIRIIRHRVPIPQSVVVQT